MTDLDFVDLEAFKRLRRMPSRPIPHAPTAYSGTLDEFYDRHAVHVLPDPDLVAYYHGLLAKVCNDPSFAFIVRYVDAATRGIELETRHGDKYRPSDNSPAWWFHYLLYNRLVVRPDDFRALLDDAPTHMFEVARSIPTSVSAAGWHVAHIFGAKDGNAASDSWSREELRRRFLRNFHPCNIFYIPKTNWQRNGADPRVIAYFAARLAERFGRVWTDFVAVAGRPLEGRANGSFEFSCAETTASSPVPVDAGTGAPAVTYTYRNRLCFKAKHIEPLEPDQAFRVVVAGIGVYQMTKAQFYGAFPNIVVSASYREHGLYHGPNLHVRAARFRVADV